MKKMDKITLQFKETTSKELYENLSFKKERLKTAKENYEFEYTAMLIEEITEIESELRRRRNVG